MCPSLDKILALIYIFKKFPVFTDCICSDKSAVSSLLYGRSYLILPTDIHSIALSMEYLTLNNGKRMPALGLGLWQAEDPVEFETAVEKALEAGYRHFDTAYQYKNEHFLGNVLKRWLDSGKVKREELFITTKLPIIGLTEDRVEHFMKLSLKALQLDYVDLYLVHFPGGLKYFNDEDLYPKTADGNLIIDKNTNLLAVWKQMEAQVDAGRAKSIGVSNFNASQIERIIKSARILPSAQQVEVNAYFQQKELLKVCKMHKLAVVAYGPLGSPGRTVYYQKGGVSNFNNFECPPILEDPIVTEIAKKYKKSNGQILLRHLIQLGVAPIPKSTNAQRLSNNLNVFDFELTAEDMARLETLDKGNAGRSFTFKAFKGIEDHPEFPFKE